MLGARPGTVGRPPAAQKGQRPTLELSFLNRVLPPGVALVRATNATVVGPDGITRFAPHNHARQSSDLSLAPWSRDFSSGSAPVVTGGYPAPDGSQSASLVDLSTDPQARVNTTVVGVQGVGFGTVFSVWVCALPGESGVVGLQARDTGSTYWPGTRAITDQWQRIWVYAPPTLGNGSTQLFWAAHRGAGATTLPRYLMWGAQIESKLDPADQTPGPYVANTGTTGSFHGPRFDHHPQTRLPLGLLIEEGRTNSLPNAQGSGGSAGVLPTGWSMQSSSGITTSVVGAGVDNGRAYVDVNVAGTTTAAAYPVISPQGGNMVAALSGDSWAGSWEARRVGGANPVATGWTLTLSARDSGGTLVAGGGTVALDTAAGGRKAVVAALTDAATAWVQLRLLPVLNSAGIVVDETLRLLAPQLERCPSALCPTSYIPTITGAVARGDETCTLANVAWLNPAEGTFVSEANYVSPGHDSRVYGLRQASTLVFGARRIPDNSSSVIARDGGVRDITLSGAVATGLQRVAVSYKSGLAPQGSLAGGAAVPGGGVFTMPAISSLCFGSDGSGNAFLNGHIRSLTYHAKALATLPALGAISPPTTLSLNFLSGDMPAGLGFTRPTPATRVNPAGLLETVAAHVPRIDHDPVTLRPLGLLLEDPRTNLRLQSSNFAVGWTRVDITLSPSADAAPDGTPATLVTQGVLGTANLYQYAAGVSTASAHTSSVYLKRGNADWVAVMSEGGGGASSVVVNLATGSAGSAGASGADTGFAATIANAGNGWFRVAVTALNATATSRSLQLWAVTDGTGATRQAGGSYNVFGAQLEQGDTASSHIPTGAAPALRAADSCTTALGGWYIQHQGTMLAELIKRGGQPQFTSAAAVGSVGRWIYFNNNAAQMYDSTSIGVGGNLVPGAVTRVAAAVGAGLAISANGAAPGTAPFDGSFGANPTLLYIGSRDGTADQLNGWLRSLSYSPFPLAGASLQKWSS